MRRTGVGLPMTDTARVEAIVPGPQAVSIRESPGAGALRRDWPEDLSRAIVEALVRLRLGTLWKWVFNVLLAASLIVASVLFLVVTVPPLFGLKTMIVTGGSMSPKILAGDAALVERSSWTSVQVGDVIVFGRMGGDGMTTHRVVAIRAVQGRTYFQTKGDANSTPDGNLAPAEALNGTVALTLPKAGYLLSLARSLPGVFFITVLPLFAIVRRQVRWLLRSTKTRPGPRGTRVSPEAKSHEAGETA